MLGNWGVGDQLIVRLSGIVYSICLSARSSLMVRFNAPDFVWSPNAAGRSADDKGLNLSWQSYYSFTIQYCGYLFKS